MTIIRRCKRQSNFTIIDNDVLRDGRMSWKAQGILTYCLSLPDNWEINIKHLSRLRPDGRDSTMSGLKELKELGYIRKVRITDDRGRVVKWETQIFDTPQHFDQNTENPDPGHTTIPETQNTENPGSGLAGAIINTSSKKNLDQRKKIDKKDDRSFSDDQGSEMDQEDLGSEDLGENSTSVNTKQETQSKQKGVVDNPKEISSAAPPPQNFAPLAVGGETWDVNYLNKIWEANKSPKWRRSSLLFLTNSMLNGLDRFLVMAGGDRAEAYRLIGISIAEMAQDEFYGSRGRNLSDVIEIDALKPCKTYCGHWLGAALEAAEKAKKTATEKTIATATEPLPLPTAADNFFLSQLKELL